MGFHSRDLNKNVQELTKLGHKVAVAEQQETRNEMDKRIKKTKKKPKDADCEQESSSDLDTESENDHVQKNCKENV